MIKFFKKIGVGILTIILAPFALAGFAIFIVIATVVFLVYLCIAVVKFFKGDKLGDPDALDREAAKIIYNKMKAENNPEKPQPQQGQFAGATINIYGNMPQNTANPEVPKINEDNVIDMTEGDNLQITEKETSGYLENKDDNENE
jgi:hypothetical protein